jgi:hypothetical protein
MNCKKLVAFVINLLKNKNPSSRLILTIDGVTVTLNDTLADEIAQCLRNKLEIVKIEMDLNNNKS